jgi:hypothetical protein
VPVFKRIGRRQTTIGTFDAKLYGLDSRGKDGEIHRREVDATSVFDAADTVIQEWHRLWCWSSSSLIEIESGPDRWKVNQATVTKWRKTKAVK